MPSMVWMKDSCFIIRVCAVRVLEIEGNVLKLCLYNLKNKCVSTELVGYTSTVLYFCHNFHFSVHCTKKELIF